MSRCVYTAYSEQAGCSRCTYTCELWCPVCVCVCVCSFVARMNAVVASLGMANTRLANPHGLTHTKQWSCAKYVCCCCWCSLNATCQH